MADFATGTEIASHMRETFPDSDWVGKIAEQTQTPRATLEAYLERDAPPPDHIRTAALQLIEDSRTLPEELPTGNANPDDLPFAGIPNFIGKLHKE
ncbi:hypothetical protein [Bosea sp. BK604]|uniref:hypothetical protein n=1 Tax=Bosea sp. BK604 TaxID=2512180 RepID=UPI001050581D|nr:hypothetical protein [Bosea sp. BK604]TCR68264.1 hypothetical protein EV560_10291 [Bosea sp. BK604]